MKKLIDDLYDEIKKLDSFQNIKKEDIDKNYSVFESSLNSLNQCKNCKGLKFCKSKIKGYFNWFEYYDDEYINVYRKCKYQVKNDKQIELENKYLNKFYYCDISKNNYNLQLKDLEKDEFNIELINELVNICKNDLKKGLYIYGKVATGKTYCMIAFANSYTNLNNKGSFIKTCDFLNMMTELKLNDVSKFEQIINKIKKSDFVIFDDIGSEKVSEFRRDDILFNILDYRMSNNLLTFFTSNLNIEDLLKVYIQDELSQIKAERLIERIQTLAKPFNLKGSSRRKNIE